MKHMKKAISLLLALVMALALATTAGAVVDPKEWSMANWGDVTGHTFTAYQVFKGDQTGDPSESGQAKPLTNITWGDNINSATFLAALKADERFNVMKTTGSYGNIFEDCTTAAQVAAALSEYGAVWDENGWSFDKPDQYQGSSVSEEDATRMYAVSRAFGLVAAQHVTGSGQTITPTQTTGNKYQVTLTGGNGYYLFVDTTNLAGQDDARNPALLQVTNQGVLYISKKYDTPTVDKSVKDSDGTWGEAADYNIGDTVTFRLVGTLPSNISDYTHYSYAFYDTIDPAFALDSSYYRDVKVYFVYTDVDIDTFDFSVTNHDVFDDFSSGFNVDYTAPSGSTAGSLVINDNDIISYSASDKFTKDTRIVVIYTATLTDKAKIGTTTAEGADKNKGNPNDVYLKYTNDPSWDGTGTSPMGQTPKDRVMVYTYELDITKINGATSAALQGAKFKLYKGTGDNKQYVTVDTANKVTGWDATGTEFTTNESGLIKIIGLDAGTYYLTETDAPAGYNTLEADITVVIAATLDKSEDNPALTALTIKVDNNNAQDGDLTTGIVSMNVENYAGATLPETGGIGTTLFYVIGAVLVAGAAVVLITRKRVRDEA